MVVVESRRNPGIIFTVLGLLQTNKVFGSVRELTGFAVAFEEVYGVVLCTGAIF